MIREEHMYPTIKTYLESLGFVVKAEIGNVDVMAIKDELVIAVEMKTSFTTRLIYQGLKRMHTFDYVYLAIPKPTGKVLKSSGFKEKKTIVRRLELGLLLVDSDKKSVDVVIDPEAYRLQRQKKKRVKLLKEFHARRTGMNTGGVTKTKIMTAYRELALLVLDALKDGPETTAYLRAYTNRKKVVSILQKNHYGWFERVDRGIYRMTSSGEKALETYQEEILLIKASHVSLESGT
jgi:hypothetical protein